MRDRGFQKKIGSLAEGMKEGRGRNSSFKNYVAAFGVGGWLLAIPVAGGVYLGWYLDRKTGGGIFWTIALLFAGMLIGIYNLYYFYKRWQK